MNYSGAGFILLSSDLLMLLLVHDTRSGKWGFPKGHREPEDSSDLATATRECYEETGLLPEDYTIMADVFKVSKGSQSYNFRYAVLADEKRKTTVRPGPPHEIAGVQWVPIKQLLEADNVLDGNKYLRTWVADIRADVSKKSVNLFKTLLALGPLGPLQETVSTGNVVACA